MFKNYQEFYGRQGERGFKIEFGAFNPNHDRIKLIVSAILIPVGCTFFYFLQSGHKIAELKMAISNLENIQPLEIDNDHIPIRAGTDVSSRDTGSLINIPSLTSATNQDIIEENKTGNINDSENGERDLATVASAKNELLPGENLTELIGFLIINKASASDSATDNEHEESITGRSQTELAMLITNEYDDSTSQVKTQRVDSGMIGSKNNVSNLISNSQLMEKEPKIILSEKIIDLLESEIPSTDVTTDTGKYKRFANGHSNSKSTKRSFDVNKLELILGDI